MERLPAVFRNNNSPLLQIDYVPLHQLKRNARSPRTHPEKQIVKLARNIDTFGFVLPCLVDEKNQLLTGTARVLAAERLGMNTIPIIRIQHLSDIEKRAFIIADNKLAEMGAWDPNILRSELEFFTNLNIDFDFSILGFETAEVDIILDATDSVEEHVLSHIATGHPPVSRPGDLWIADQHQILCGDALDPDSYSKLLGAEQARLVVTDPPYNVPIAGHVSGKGAIQHREFAMASGEMTSAQFQSFLENVFATLARFSVDGSLHYVFMDWRHAGEIIPAGKVIYSELKNICVWRKTNAGMGSLYRSQHEFIFVFKNGTAAHINNVNLGVHGRSRSNVWDYAGINSFGSHRDELLAIHPTVKPVALIADVIKDASARGDLILDPFAGSGSAVIAAEKTKRRAAVIEIDPLYESSRAHHAVRRVRRPRSATTPESVRVSAIAFGSTAGREFVGSAA